MISKKLIRQPPELLDDGVILERRTGSEAGNRSLQRRRRVARAGRRKGKTSRLGASPPFVCPGPCARSGQAGKNLRSSFRHTDGRETGA